jgi:hypothetical protein
LFLIEWSVGSTEGTASESRRRWIGAVVFDGGRG